MQLIITYNKVKEIFRMWAKINKENPFYTDLGIKVDGASYFLMDCETSTDESGAIVIEDVNKLPTNVGVGSKALHIQTALVYMFGPSKKWIKYNGSSILN